MIDKINCIQYTTVSDTCKYCYTKIRELLKNRQIDKSAIQNCYVGTTHDLEERELKHIAEKGMNTILVLCEIPTKYKTQLLENKLIKRLNKIKVKPQCGGIEIVEQHNFVYLLLP